MTCQEYLDSTDRTVTEEAKARFANLKGGCLGIVERDGKAYAHSELVVRRVVGSKVTLYLPSAASTFTVSTDSSARIDVGGMKVRPRDLIPGDQISVYVPAEAMPRPNPVIEEIMMGTECDDMVTSPAMATAALPTTG